MIKKCAVKIADWLIECNAIPESDRELYEYALYSIFVTLSPVILVIGIGFLFGAVWRSILIILPFSVIRKYSGGYHTKKLGRCLITSSLLLVLCIVLSFSIQCNWILICITAGAIISLAYFSPIENENRILNKEEHIRYKKTVIMLVSIFFIIDLLLLLLHSYTGTICISIGINLSACLQFPTIFNKVKNDQKQVKNVVS